MTEIAAGHHGLAATWHPGRPALGIPHHAGPAFGVRVETQSSTTCVTTVGEVEVRGPWIAGSYYGDVTSQVRFRLICAPVTSAHRRAKASSPSRQKTSSSPAVNGSPRLRVGEHLSRTRTWLEAAVVGVPDLGRDDRWRLS